MDIFSNHKKLYVIATILFLILTLFVAILPALDNQSKIHPLPDAIPLTQSEKRGKDIFIANGCVACHSQQVRNVEMDRKWGSRPSISADYAGNKRVDFWTNTATLMGTERTGPDLIDIGTRQPSLDWHLVHLYNPRIVVKESIMPSYSFLFTSKESPDKEDVVVSVPETFLRDKELKIVATQDALDLVAYLQALKQTPLPGTIMTPEFLYPKEQDVTQGVTTGQTKTALDGKNLYMNNCAACHQANGEGLSGAFPPLKNSAIVTGDNLQLFVDIIMNGYDAREEYGVMPAVGTNANWTEEEVTAIVNYERNNWGNKAPLVTVEEVKQIMDYINQIKDK
ncbi:MULTISPECIES: cbb3-type cytochrome c oxidase subunit II [Myroides]|uniref:Cytochrome c oxidase, cbb3-type, subunit II n=1 Tax=Myroides odoratimimus CIP 101113 TaxID=883154 RepID=A0AAV3F308_9FLAO|nr:MULTISPECIES: cbb3-type cytochrome c oxidase subunit II [Myroides]AJA70191.1 Cbb3-type cytochrome oxidase, cytochrome c subunit [Myroides sp. A21]EHO11696.1 cytochrome c oxidase, cbb3-type, subunit II [Myroides odoratimimus CIP 101113]